MILEQFRKGNCFSYLVGCEHRSVALLIDPEASSVEGYLANARRHGVHVRYLLDTHSHADHFSATRQLAEELHIPVIMHQASPAPYVTIHVDDGDSLIVGQLRIKVLHTPGHTMDSISLLVEDCLFTGDSLLIGATGRTDLPGSDAAALYDSLFGRILQLPPETRIFPAHSHQDQKSSTIGEELSTNPKLQVASREDFVTMINSLNHQASDHLSEALRVNCSGGKAITQMIAEAADRIPFMGFEEVKARMAATDRNIVLLDVREGDAYGEGHIPGALHLPRGQLELKVDTLLLDPAQRIVVYCEYGKISILATAMLRDIGFRSAVALDGGFESWRKAGHPVAVGCGEEEA